MTEQISVGPSDAVERQRGTISNRPKLDDENTKKAAYAIAEQLGEPNAGLMRLVVHIIGLERANSLLREVLALEAQGGMMTTKGDRRRTPGGIFFKRVRQTTSSAERKIIFPMSRGTRGGRDRKSNKQPAAVPLLTWAEAVAFIKETKQKSGAVRTVKTTLIGRPGETRDLGECVLLRMTGKPPGSLPKGLPVPPEGTAITWAVFVVAKQWNGVEKAINADQEDQLIIEGYPMIKDGTPVLLAQSCKSMFQDRAAKMAKANKVAG